MLGTLSVIDKLILYQKKKKIMAHFYGRGSAASRLGPLQGCNLLFTTKFLELPLN